MQATRQNDSINGAWPEFRTFLIVVLGLSAAFTFWINRAYQGDPLGSFMLSEAYGLPKRLADAGLQPVGRLGWDSQFLYMIANDPWAADPDTKDHIDLPAYRYQRGGIAILAHYLSRALGFDLASPVVYHALQIFIVALGFTAIASWLRAHGRNPLWACAWLFSPGVPESLAHGLGDPVADALFAIAVVSALRGALWLYVPAAVLLPLVRESFVLVTGAIALATLFGRVAWQDRIPVPLGRDPRSWLESVNWPVVVTAALPLIPFAAWQVFLWWRFGETAAQSGTTGLHLLDLPFRQAWSQWSRHWAAGRVMEIVLIPAAIVTHLFTMWLIVRRHRGNPIWLAVFLHFVLLLGLGFTQFIEVFSFAKAYAHVLIALMIAMALASSRIGVVLLCCWGAVGLSYNLHHKSTQLYHRDVESGVQRRWSTADLLTATDAGSVPVLGMSTEFSASLAVSPGGLAWPNRARSLLALGRRDIATIDVAITNTGLKNWRTAIYGWPPDEVVASYRLRDEKGRASLGIASHLGEGDVASGETRRVKLAIIVPAPGNYTVEVALRRPKHGWFGGDADPFLRIPLRVE
ncbi:MAG: hypothetical protein FJX47_11590 [Alphaproteobacteria bacterium]|nr:hypothetical protein [Alphaproteobacteria bacterium]